MDQVAFVGSLNAEQQAALIAFRTALQQAYAANEIALVESQAAETMELRNTIARLEREAAQRVAEIAALQVQSQQELEQLQRDHAAAMEIVVAEKKHEADALQARCNALSEELQTHVATINELDARCGAKDAEIAKLAIQLQNALEEIERIQNPSMPSNHVAPNDFVKRFTPEELIQVQLSLDPYVILGRTDVQTIITYIDLDAEATRQYVARLVELKILTTERAIEILTKR